MKKAKRQIDPPSPASPVACHREEWRLWLRRVSQRCPVACHGELHFKNTSLTNSYNIHTTAFSLIRKINGVLLECIKSINGAEPWSGVNGLR